MSLDNALWLVGVATEAAVVGLLVYRRVWRTLPIFFAYCAWDLLGAAVAYPIIRFFPASYFAVYLAQIVVESALELGILVELTWSVLRPFRASLPRGSLLVISGLVLALGAAIWPFAVIPGFGNFPPQWHLLMRLGQTTSILRVLLFLALAGCSQLLSIGWRDHRPRLLLPCRPGRGDAAYAPYDASAVCASESGRGGQLPRLASLLGLQLLPCRGQAAGIQPADAGLPAGLGRYCQDHPRRADRFLHGQDGKAQPTLTPAAGGLPADSVVAAHPRELIPPPCFARQTNPDGQIGPEGPLLLCSRTEVGQFMDNGYLGALPH